MSDLRIFLENPLGKAFLASSAGGEREPASARARRWSAPWRPGSSAALAASALVILAMGLGMSAETSRGRTPPWNLACVPALGMLSSVVVNATGLAPALQVCLGALCITSLGALCLLQLAQERRRCARGQGEETRPCGSCSCPPSRPGRRPSDTGPGQRGRAR